MRIRVGQLVGVSGSAGRGFGRITHIEKRPNRPPMVSLWFIAAPNWGGCDGYRHLDAGNLIPAEHLKHQMSNELKTYLRFVQRPLRVVMS